jgi:hypothetical protein
VRRDTPIHTFWAIILMTVAALVVTHLYEVPGDQALWVFVAFMLLGLPIGELAERVSNRGAKR